MEVEGRTLRVTEATQAGDARRLAQELARQVGFDEPDAGKVAIAVTESATNLVKHGGGGEIVLRVLSHGTIAGIEMLVLDRGAGITNVAECLRDGFSTAGSPGTGLGAVRRASALFDLYSVPRAGTAILARFWPLRDAPDGDRLQLGVVSVPKSGEHVCGDAWAVEQLPGRVVIVVADGLGHGPGAAEAARAALQTFRTRLAQGPLEMIEAMHDPLRRTRGAAVSVAEIDTDRRLVRFSGVGNVAGAVLSRNGSRRMVSGHGTVGLSVRKVQEFAYPWPDGALLVMHTDGLGTRWDLDAYPGLSERHPGLVAAVLYRDFCRGNDDATVVVVREMR
jgi:anti-sigma regulatory factor (Ser/Thr protein kinase)